MFEYINIFLFLQSFVHICRQYQSVNEQNYVLQVSVSTQSTVLFANSNPQQSQSVRTETCNS